MRSSYYRDDSNYRASLWPMLASIATCQAIMIAAIVWAATGIGSGAIA
jgi:hypothetical protein